MRSSLQATCGTSDAAEATARIAAMWDPGLITRIGSCMRLTSRDGPGITLHSPQTLDLFFYLDLRSNRLRTLHYAVKGDGGDPARRQDCLESLRVARSN
jgi:hypothetical protein